MSSCSIQGSIGALAAARPDLLAWFEELGIDYCCHGADTLAQACQRAGVDLARVLERFEAEVASPATAVDPASTSMSDWCDEIERSHHALARQLFARLDALAPKVASAHGAAHPEYLELEQVLRQLRDDMFDHMTREERVLFPWIRRIEEPRSIHVGPPWSVRRPIDCMLHDHDVVAAALARIRSLTHGYAVPEGGCASVAAYIEALHALDSDTRRHVHKENNILFPMAIEAESCRAGGRAATC